MVVLEQSEGQDLKERLVDKSVEAYALALETVNRITVQYRLDASCYLFCNAWELLLKAKVAEDAGTEGSIYRNQSKNGARLTLSLRDCLNRVFPKLDDPVRRNIERIVELRDDAVHFVISHIPRDIIGLLQASAVNYHRKLNEWFGTSLSDRFPVGMMSIVYDLSPEMHGLNDNRLRRKLGPDAAEYLTAYCADLRREYEQLQRPQEFTLTLSYRVLITNKPGEADIELTKGPIDGTATKVVEVPKDPSASHPFRLKEVIEQVRTDFPDARINQHDFRCINKVYSIKTRPDFWYQGKIPGSPSQYSPAFVGWVIEQSRRDPEFFRKTRDKAKEIG